jgi:hypothetical protein
MKISKKSFSIEFEQACYTSVSYEVVSDLENLARIRKVEPKISEIITLSNL